MTPPAVGVPEGHAEQPERLAVAIVDALRNAGAAIYFEDGKLWVDPADVLDDELRAAIRSSKPAIVRLLLPEAIRWRVARMAEQIPPLGPVSLLVVREGGWEADAGRCVSCGDRLPEGVQGTAAFGGVALRCPPCREAAFVAIQLARAGR